MKTKRQMTNRDKQALATRSKIYKEGIKLIQKHGIDGVNVTHIAKASGVSVGTFYHYFDSKLDLFMELYRKADDYYENELVSNISSLPFKEKILVYFEEYASMSETNGVKLTKKMYIPENPLFLNRDRGMHPVLNEIISDAQSKSICIDTLNSEAIAEELFIIARGVIFDWALHDNSYDLKDKMKRMLSIYLESLLV